MSSISYDHKMAAHCESGTVTALLNHAGFEISESLVFGISGSFFFGYFKTPMLPFPTFVLRNRPGRIKVNAGKRLGVRFNTAKFRDPSAAQETLDSLLERNIPTAVQVDFFYMQYLPEYARAHFNAHYIIVVGKENGRYLVSDSYNPTIATLDEETLKIARFTKGPFAPKGMMFHLEKEPNGHADLQGAVRKGIKEAAFYMLRVPIPFLGVRGIRRFAKKLITWPDLARDIDHLSHEVMMINVILEERGTGGAGFRFLYATFLREAAKIMDNPELTEMAKVMMENGDRWRDISLYAARIGKSRDLEKDKLEELSKMILERADREQEIFKRLVKIIK